MLTYVRKNAINIDIINYVTLSNYDITLPNLRVIHNIFTHSLHYKTTRYLLDLSDHPTLDKISRNYVTFKIAEI